MLNTAEKTQKHSSIFFELFKEPTNANSTAGYTRFLNVNRNAKRLDDARVRAEEKDISSYKNKPKAIDKICSEYICKGDNVISVERYFGRRCGFDSKKGLNHAEQLLLLLRPAIHNFAKSGTTRIYDENNFHGVYYLLVHPDFKEEIDNDNQLIMILKNCGIKTIELDFLPTSKNAKEETVYGSILLGAYAFGVAYGKDKNSIAYKRIDERHMIRIETVA